MNFEEYDRLEMPTNHWVNVDQGQIWRYPKEK